MSYVIYTDSACDIPSDILQEWGVRKVALTFHFDGEDKEYRNDEMPATEFYRRMRDGQCAKTAAANVAAFKEAFEVECKAGTDIFYLGFSSGLSTTYQSACLAAEEVQERYPDRKIYTVDSLAASAGQGLLLCLVCQKKAAGASLEELATYAKETRLHICHWFTVEDLKYLKRGGRISPAVALVGSVLGIKPVLHVDDEGHLISVSKVRGRKASLQALVDHMANRIGDGPVFLCHGDCINDVETIKGMIQEKYGIPVQLVVDVGPVIGAHSGPGTLAVFFEGKER